MSWENMNDFDYTGMESKMIAKYRTKSLRINNYELIPEHKFHPTRKWRFDWVLFDYKIAIEIEGGIWNNGAHVRGKHYLSDMEKYNQAQILGWKVLRYTPEQWRNFDFINDLNLIIQNK